jgi:hypothetical protein
MQVLLAVNLIAFVLVALLLFLLLTPQNRHRARNGKNGPSTYSDSPKRVLSKAVKEDRHEV